MDDINSIPTMSVIDHPRVLLCDFKADSSASTHGSMSFANMITGSVLFGPKNAYFRCAGRGLSSTIGDSSTDSFARGDSLFFACIFTFSGRFVKF